MRGVTIYAVHECKFVNANRTALEMKGARGIVSGWSLTKGFALVVLERSGLDLSTGLTRVLHAFAAFSYHKNIISAKIKANGICELYGCLP